MTGRHIAAQGETTLSLVAWQQKLPEVSHAYERYGKALTLREQPILHLHHSLLAFSFLRDGRQRMQDLCSSR